VYLSDTGQNHKVIIAHEFGHYLAGKAGVRSGDCSLDYLACPSPVGGDGHSLASKEYQSCALSEGIGHFVAAATWNSFQFLADSDCSFRYYKTEFGNPGPETVDCEGWSGSYGPAFMETVCGGTSGRGVELDWLRTLWDVSGPGTFYPVSMTDVFAWLTHANSSIYSDLDTRANTVGGNLNSNWDSWKAVNGVDW
jgi:hypothetical protein